MNSPFSRALIISLAFTLVLPFPRVLAAAKPTVVVPPLSGDPQQKARLAIVRDLEASGKVKVLVMETVDRYLQEHTSAVSSSPLSLEGLDYLEKGQKSYKDLKIKEAINQLLKAKMSFRKSLDQEGAFQGLRAAQFYLAMAYLAKADGSKARQEIKEVVLLDSKRATRPISEKLYAPNVRKLYAEVRDEMLKGKLGELHVRSTPPGAITYVDGDSIGSTPADIKGLPPGEHFVRVEAEGRLPFFSPKFIVAGKNRMEISLKSAAPIDPQQYFSLVNSSQEIDHARAAFLDEMGLALGGDIFLFLVPGRASVKAQLYDQRSQDVSPVEEDTSPRGLIDRLLRHIDSAGYVAPQSLTPAAAAGAPAAQTGKLPAHLQPQATGTLSEQASKPLADKNAPGHRKQWYEKPWVWGAIGGGILVIAGSLLLFTDIAKSDASKSTLTVTFP